jgi:FRG domain
VIDAGRVQSVDEFVKLVCKLAQKWQKGTWHIRKESAWLPWFRGEENADWDTALKPKLFRTRTKWIPRAVLRQEQDLRLEFKRRGSQFAGEGSPSNHWEWYFLMEHYGVPTRLLDWSDGALVALYFALRPIDIAKPPDAAVYMLDPWWLNKLVYKQMPIAKADRPVGTALPNWEEAKPYLSEDEFANEYLGPRVPLAIDPSHVARRFAAQRSRFTIFGRDPDGLNTVVDRAKKDDRRLRRILIKRSAVDSMRRDLATCGLSESTIFPDLEGFGRELNSLFKELWMRK